MTSRTIKSTSQQKLNVVLFCGGPSSEYDISIVSCQTILTNIDYSKYSVAVCYIDKNLNAKLLKTPVDLRTHVSTATTPLILLLQEESPDIDLALLAGIHGEFAEDGHLQGLLEYFDIPYTGSGLAASALAMDKFRSSLLVSQQEIALIPPLITFPMDSELDTTSFTYPLIFKPNTLGSSIGVCIVDSHEKLTRHLEAQKIHGYSSGILQEYISDAVEITCGSLQKYNGEFIQLPPVEIIPQTSVFFDYRAKYTLSASRELIPPVSISKELSADISEIACHIHGILGCSVYSRSDFLVKDDEIYYLETNTLPGMTMNSLVPKEAQAIGMSFTKLIDFIIQNSYAATRGRRGEMRETTS